MVIVPFAPLWRSCARENAFPNPAGDPNCLEDRQLLVSKLSTVLGNALAQPEYKCRPEGLLRTAGGTPVAWGLRRSAFLFLLPTQFAPRGPSAMFGSVGMPELLIIMVVALLVFGPR